MSKHRKNKTPLPEPTGPDHEYTVAYDAVYQVTTVTDKGLWTGSDEEDEIEVYQGTDYGVRHTYFADYVKAKSKKQAEKIGLDAIRAEFPESKYDVLY